MKEPMEHSAFPSDETLAAFIDGRLDEETRKLVIAHVADCVDCYGTFEAAGVFHRESETAATVRHIQGRTVQYSAAAVAATFAVVLALQPATARYREWRDQRALRIGANELLERSTEARLSLGLEYRRFPQFRSLSTEERGNAELIQAFTIINSNNDTHPTVATRHSLGLAYLLLGNPDQAATALTEAVKQQASSADIHTAIVQCRDVDLLNDLSAALEAQSGHTGGPYARALAQQAAERALRLNPRSEVAAWNRAVAVERAGARGEAISAWSDYLAIDQSSAWRVEAATRLHELKQD
jgi:tetratricopeptide (TPR) repeat protein